MSTTYSFWCASPSMMVLRPSALPRGMGDYNGGVRPDLFRACCGTCLACRDVALFALLLRTPTSGSMEWNPAGGSDMVRRTQLHTSTKCCCGPIIRHSTSVRRPDRCHDWWHGLLRVGTKSEPSNKPHPIACRKTKVKCKSNSTDWGAS